MRYALTRSNSFADHRYLRLDSKPSRQIIYPLDAFPLQCHMKQVTKIKTVCVYCGSGPGTNPHFVETAVAPRKDHGRERHPPGLWRRLARPDGRDSNLRARSSGIVAGIIPDFLTARENALTRVQEMIVTPDMHERKRLMFERSDAFVALPGGIGGAAGRAGGAIDLAAARPPQGRCCSPISTASQGATVRAARTDAGDAVHPLRSPAIDILKAERVEELSCRGCAAQCGARARGRGGNGAGNRAAALTPYSNSYSAGNVTASMRLPSGSMTKAA